MSIRNNLRLNELQECSKLTELEGAVISRNILFQKIHQLPKSRWTALTDKIINVPINEEALLNTVKKLPKTPREAGLIGVSLKRKLEYKNSYRKQLINPEKVFRMLSLLKSSGNPYYQFYSDFNACEQRCKVENPEGYEVIFSKLDNIEERVDCLPNYSNYPLISEVAKSFSNHIDSGHDDDDSSKNEKDAINDEEDFLANDPVRKYQISYNKSLCLSKKYPEAGQYEDIEDIEIAPGEGERPSDLLREKDWDVKAFPHLHNLDGRNGKDEKRKVYLSDQNYFIQRILNKDLRFAKTPTYEYAAVGYLEKKAIQRNINLAGTRVDLLRE